MKVFRIGFVIVLIFIQVVIFFAPAFADRWIRKEEVVIEPDSRQAIKDPAATGRAPEKTGRPATGTKQRSYGDVHVTLYMTSWCPYCRRAREFLNSLGVSVTEHDIEKDKGKAEEKRRVSGGYSGVPLIDIEGILVRGFSPTAIKDAIERRRTAR